MAKTYEPLEILKDRVKGRKLREVARTVPCSPGFLSDIISGRRPNIPDEVVSALGLERVVTYRRKKEKANE